MIEAIIMMGATLSVGMLITNIWKWCEDFSDYLAIERYNAYLNGERTEP
jgi:hypothetical protein